MELKDVPLNLDVNSSGMLLITERAKFETGNPLVTISCITYNQENYIKNALDSFLQQITNFQVEIIIYDDCSTDNTVQILREYEERWPTLIKLNLSLENKFAKNENVNKYNLKVSAGDFVAFCHGDDYWIDPFKLQKQVGFMIKFNADISGHPAQCISADGHQMDNLTGYRVTEASYMDASELIKRKGNMLPFGSIMVNKNGKRKLLDNMPPVMFHTGLQLCAASSGGLLVMPEVMSVYRVETPGCATHLLLKNEKTIQNTILLRVKSIKAIMKLYDENYQNSLIKLLLSQYSYDKTGSLFFKCKLTFLLVKGESLKNIFKVISNYRRYSR